MKPGRGEQGFTLIELMISLGLFALIAVAGLALLNSVLGVQGRTEQRLDRLADLQRAMFVLGGDLDQVTEGAVRGGGTSFSFTRSAPGLGGPPMPVRYDLAGGNLVRTAGTEPQVLLSGVSSARWRFYDGQWSDAWPLQEELPGWPRAVEVELLARGPGGDPVALRKLVVLPFEPRQAEPS